MAELRTISALFGVMLLLGACQNPLLPRQAFETPPPAPVPGEPQVAQTPPLADRAPFEAALQAFGPPTGTVVGDAIQEMTAELLSLQDVVTGLRTTLLELRARSSQDAAEYFDTVGAISARLQNGSTPGNPILVEQRNNAEVKLDQLTQDIGLLNALATQIASAASRAAFLLENVRATYGLSGALEEDHVQLAALEDEVNRTVVQIDRLLNDISDDINRQSNYVTAERRNLQTLTLAINNGELYGLSLANRAFSQFTPLAPPRALARGGFGQSAIPGARPTSPPVGAFDPTGGVPRPGLPDRPLVVIRFDRPNVDYEQAVYQSVSQALDRFPDARFELIAVSPSAGNPAQVALAASDAKRNAEDVLRTLTQLGLPLEQVRLSAATSPDAQNPEVHIFVR